MMHLLKKVITVAVLTAGLLSSLASAKAQTFTTYSGNTTGQPVFNRPVSTTTLSSVGTAVHYETHSYTPTTTTNVRIRSVATGGWDNYLLIYNGTFNPDAPLTNLVALNDDFPSVGVSGFPSFAVTAGTNYTIVTTAYNNPSFGAYTNTISAVLVANGTTLGGPTFARPASSNTSLNPGAPIYPVNAISSSANAVRYQAKTFTVPTSGLYRVQSEAITSGFDLFTILYKGTFTPGSPLTNVMIANDDFGSVEVSGFDIGLEANQTYTLVTTGIDNTQFGQYYYSYQKLYDFRAGFSGSTVGRTGIDISSLAIAFPDLSGSGNAVPFRAFRVAYGAGGFYRFQLFSKTFTATAYNPVLAVYEPVFDNTDPETNVDLVYDNYPLLDTFDLNFASAGSLIFVVSGFQNTDAGDFRLEAFGDAAVTITPVAVVKGNVTLKTFIDNPPASPKSFPVKIVFRPTPSGADTIVNATLSSSNGSYVANVPEGTFNVGFKSQTLQNVVMGVNTTSGIATGVNASALFGADANDDNFTDINDLLPLISAYNQISPAAGYNALADFNFDGVNDIADLLIVIAYYNQSGQFLP